MERKFMNEISKRLRDICVDIRRKPVSLSELIPLMQQAADEIDKLEDALEARDLEDYERNE